MSNEAEHEAFERAAQKATRVNTELDHDDKLHDIDRVAAWRDTHRWLDMVGAMRTEADLGPEVPAEVLALAFYAVRRLEGGGVGAPLARSRMMDATMPDAGAVMDLARAAEAALERERARRDRMLAELTRAAMNLRESAKHEHLTDVPGHVYACELRALADALDRIAGT